MNRPNVILEKSMAFALLIIDYCELLEGQKKYIVANQLLKSGTSIGANIHEAQNAESKSDFIHKLKIAAKELEESKYWIQLCQKANSYPTPGSTLLGTSNELGLILYKILSTSVKTKN